MRLGDVPGAGKGYLKIGHAPASGSVEIRVACGKMRVRPAHRFRFEGETVRNTCIVLTSADRRVKRG
ncbi:MAG: hypothetical protein AMXMBFR7_12310 [Planctomycetota bacterium]